MPPEWFDRVKHDPQLMAELDQAVRAVDAEEGSILLLTGGGQALRFVLSVSPMAEKLIGTQQPVTRGVVGLVASFQQPTINNHTVDDPQHDPSIDKRVGSQTQSQMAVPLSDAQHEFGVVTAINSRRDGGFADADLRQYLKAARAITSRLAELSGGMAHA
ncbi:MAG: GAF domain-containing protein [Planctomycetota bacterium]